MLFGKRKQVVKRILIVEDEPLTAFDNENMLGDAGYEIVATVDDLDEALDVLEREEVAPDPQRRPVARRADRDRACPRRQGEGRADPVRDRAMPIPAPRKSPSAASQALYRTAADARRSNASTATCRARR